ncbi:MAG TPA: DMT family transporter, partial [Solirubrobacteraceae bacterium]|nr:DMT family transporter [Solirubrobacteraceae bacterium]
MSRARAAELALVAIAAVWGLTFVMVQDAVEELPVTAFLAYRFIPAALLVALVFRRDLARLSPAGWRIAAVIGLFLTAGYLLQTLGLKETTASNAGFITGLFVVLTPLLGAVVLRQRAGRTAWLAAGASAVGLFLLSGAGAEFRLAGDGLVLLCAIAFSAHILATDRGVAHHPTGALVAVQLGVCGLLCLLVAGA